MRACRNKKSKPEEELGTVGRAAPAEEGAELSGRKQHGEGRGRQRALRRDPPARPFDTNRYIQEQWHVVVAVASFVAVAA